MPTFVFLLFLAAALLWLLLSFCFIPLGRFVYRLIKDARMAISAEDPSNTIKEIEEKK